MKFTGGSLFFVITSLTLCGVDGASEGLRQKVNGMQEETMSKTAMMFNGMQEETLSKTAMMFHNAMLHEMAKVEDRKLILCDSDFTIHDLLFVSGPLFVLGTVNVIDKIEGVYDEFFSNNEEQPPAEDVTLLPPIMVCAGSDTTVSEMGSALEMEACAALDFLSDTDVWAFGFEDSNKGFCTAMNPSEGTYGIGQSGIFPEAKLAGGLITISVDALGVSLNKALSADTLNELWDNSGPPAVKTVRGHVAIRGTGSIGIDVLENVKCTIDIDTTLLINADYNGDGLSPVMADGSASIDFAVLASGSATPKFEITNKGETKTLDLSTLISGDVDVYSVVNGDDTALQLAASINVRLQGICDSHPILAILCELFDGESGVSGAVRSYVNSGGFGIRYAVSGKIGLKSDFIEDVVGWPDDGFEFDVSFSLGFKGVALYICAEIDTSDINKEWCWHKCSSHSECNESEFCHAFGMCLPDRDLGGACLENQVCRSGYCVGGFCSECPAIDTLEGCPSGEFCTQTFTNIGYRCVTKRDNGGTCSSGNACKSGHCVRGFCSECPTLDSSTGCPSGEFCTQTLTDVGYRCVTKRGYGGTCSSNNACKSGYCVRGFCSECPTLDSSRGCSSKEFCTFGAAGYVCANKRGRGGSCLSNNVCLSGKCDAGFCVDCYRSGSGCKSWQYCDLGRCKTKLSRGSWCVEDRVCRNGDCRLTWSGPKCN